MTATSDRLAGSSAGSMSAKSRPVRCPAGSVSRHPCDAIPGRSTWCRWRHRRRRRESRCWHRSGYAGKYRARSEPIPLIGIEPRWPETDGPAAEFSERSAAQPLTWLRRPLPWVACTGGPSTSGSSPSASRCFCSVPEVPARPLCCARNSTRVRSSTSCAAACTCRWPRIRPGCARSWRRAAPMLRASGRWSSSTRSRSCRGSSTRCTT